MAETPISWMWPNISSEISLVIKLPNSTRAERVLGSPVKTSSFGLKVLMWSGLLVTSLALLTADLKV